MDIKRNYSKEIESLKTAQKIDVKDERISYLLGRALRKTRKYSEAIEELQKVKSDFKKEQVILSLAECYRGLKKTKPAIKKYEEYLEFNKKNFDVYLALGYLYTDEKRHKDALKAFGNAEKINPKDHRSYEGVSKIVKDLKKKVDILDKAFKLSGEKPSLFVEKISQQAKICDWTFWSHPLANLNTLYDRDAHLSPFGVFFLDDSNELQQKIAKKFWIKRTRNIEQISKKFAYKNKKIRIGYVSPDFRDHPMMGLIPNFFRSFDRENFEVYSYSTYDKHNKSENRKLVKKYSTQYFDIDDMEDKNIIDLILSHEIDILVDLAGYTANSKTQIFAYKPAPITIQYLGFAGTMGSNSIDYMIADINSIPQKNRKYITEKVIYMPNTYFTYDDIAKVDYENCTKKYYGLPEDKFLLCCFNNLNKVSPKEFKIWMDILKNNNDVVLVMKVYTKYAADNLKAAAEKNGVNSNRLFFIKRLPHAKHLATYSLMDLFVDTFNFNAHTTAVEALYMNLPVITKAGDSVASRAASGILKGVKLDHLICETEEEYQNLIQHFISNKDELSELKNTLKNNKGVNSLFDAKQFVKNIEKAYKIIHKKYQNNEQTSDIVI